MRKALAWLADPWKIPAYITAIAALWFFALVLPLAAQQSVQVPATMFSDDIAITTATTTRLVEGVANQRIYVTAFEMTSAGANNIQLISGTGATCGTGTANVTGVFTHAANGRVGGGSGYGALLALPSGTSLCVTTSAAVVVGGFIAWAIY